MRKILIALMLSAIAIAGKIEINAAESAENSDSPPLENAVIISLRGTILPEKYGGQEEAFIAALHNAQAARLIIVDIDSPGGVVDSCDRIAGELLRSPAPTIAVVRHQAVSGGAMVATACREIYMAKGARIGDIQPMQLFGSETDERSAEKIEADVRAIMAVNARQNHYPQILLEAMVSRSFEVYEVNFIDRTREFMTAEQFALWQAHADNRQKLASPPKIVSPKNKLLSLSPQEAVEYGIAKKIINSADDIIAELNLDPATLKTVNIESGKFDPQKFFDSFALSRSLGLLLTAFLLIGIAGTLVEIHTPGFGIPGACGLIGFACFFYILYSHNRAEWYEIAIFVIGIILLIIEIVILPGFGVCGAIGVICLIIGLTLAWLPDLSSDYLRLNLSGELSLALIIALGALIAAAIGFIWLAGRGAKLPFKSGAMLTDELPDYHTAMHLHDPINLVAAPAANPRNAGDNSENLSAQLNKSAIAFTDLRPAGKIQTRDGKIFDAISRGDFIEKNQTVKIVSIQDGHITVSAVINGTAKI